ncbi:hypothetical protein [uncultured Tyzzerella sp.]|uniref:hypothetical protein n=1 Tax=uncultured Tyzzerella sp. TaxID=2321398 RepID=UPI0029432C35|nr:hypothetical protein [uncultured Tyzzerella sp.]
MKKIQFEEISNNDFFADYTAECSGARSDCCTRVCTRDDDDDIDVWGKFLEIEGGVIQY